MYVCNHALHTCMARQVHTRSLDVGSWTQPSSGGRQTLQGLPDLAVQTHGSGIIQARRHALQLLQSDSTSPQPCYLLGRRAYGHSELC